MSKQIYTFACYDLYQNFLHYVTKIVTICNKICYDNLVLIQITKKVDTQQKLIAKKPINNYLIITNMILNQREGLLLLKVPQVT